MSKTFGQRIVVLEVPRTVLLRVGPVERRLRSGEYQGICIETSSGRTFVDIPGLPFDIEKEYLTAQGITICNA